MHITIIYHLIVYYSHSNRIMYIMHIQIRHIYNSLASWRQGAHWSRGKLWCTWDPWCRLRGLGYGMVWWNCATQKLFVHELVQTWICQTRNLNVEHDAFKHEILGCQRTFSNKPTCLHMPMKPTGIYWQYLAYYTLDLSCPSPFFIWAWGCIENWNPSPSHGLEASGGKPQVA